MEDKNFNKIIIRIDYLYEILFQYRELVKIKIDAFSEIIITDENQENKENKIFEVFKNYSEKNLNMFKKEKNIFQIGNNFNLKEDYFYYMTNEGTSQAEFFKMQTQFSYFYENFFYNFDEKFLELTTEKELFYDFNNLNIKKNENKFFLYNSNLNSSDLMSENLSRKKDFIENKNLKNIFFIFENKKQFKNFFFLFLKNKNETDKNNKQQIENNSINIDFIRVFYFLNIFNIF